MTQTQPDRIDQLEALIERVDRSLGMIAADIVEIKISQARTDERLNSLETQFANIKKSTDTQFADIKIQIRAQDTRLWTFVSALVLAVVGLLARFLFFPQA